MRLDDRKKAIDLRKKGLAYSEIGQILNVGKSTLSYWLKNYPLSEDILRKKQSWIKRAENCRITKLKKREADLNKIYEDQVKRIFPLTSRELLIAGIFLYWGEGGKTDFTRISLTNTDLAMIKFFIYWATKCLKVSKTKLRIQLHLYSDMDTNKEVLYWSRELKIPIKQFNKPYIKESLQKRINHNSGVFGHGTCDVRIFKASISKEILMSMKAIADFFKRV